MPVHDPGRGTRPADAPARGPGPFGLADPDRTRTILAAAGFDTVELAAMTEHETGEGVRLGSGAWLVCARSTA